jgi:glycosyltransferase involved in cell wall biosynthesis
VAETPGRGFLYSGRLSREKGLATLIEAIGRREDLRLTVVGSGPEEERSRRLAEERAPGRVSFAGRIDREDLLSRVRGARALLMPSEWYENAPMSALEALASGVPVIATATGGLPELVRDGETGLLVPPGDPEALAQAMGRLQGDDGLAIGLGRAARSLVEAEYTLAGQIGSMLSILEEVRSCASR